jgi:hypothetical protein
MRYKHTQIGYLIIGGLFGIAIFLATTGIVAPAGRGGLLISAIIEVILLICAIVFSKLAIKIDGESLEASFAMGSFARKCRWQRLPRANQSSSAGGTAGEFT